MIGSENTLGDLRHIATTGSHLHRQLAISRYRQHLLLVVTSGTISIDAIPEKLDLVVTLTQEGEVFLNGCGFLHISFG